MATGETKRTAADKEKWIVLERLFDMMVKLAQVYEESGRGDDAKRETENAARLLHALDPDPKIGAFEMYLEDIMKKLARLQAM